jgi:hypothetical protein
MVPDKTKTKRPRAVYLSKSELSWIKWSLMKLRAAIVDVYSWHEPEDKKAMHLANCRISVVLMEAVLRQHEAHGGGQRFVDSGASVKNPFGMLTLGEAESDAQLEDLFAGLKI